MTLAIADEHRELATVAAAFLASVDARGETRSLLDASQAPLPSFWQKMAEAGWLGLHIAEEHGGSGFGMLELAIIVEALGRIAAPGPFLTTVIASSILALAGTEQQCGDLIPGLATGQTTAGLGLASTVTVASGTVSGDAGVVLGAPLADLLLIVVADDVLIVSTDVPGVVVSNQRNLDSSRPAARVRFDEVPLHDVTVLPGARSAAFSVARTLVAAEAAGGAQECAAMAVAYSKLREQFGRVIGAFGAVKHHCANMHVAAELATAAAWDAARASSDSSAQFAIASAAAAAVALPAFHRNSLLNIQVHGGIGFTWDHDAHIYVRRSAVLSALVSPAESAEMVTQIADSDVTRHFAIDLPPHAEAIRVQVRSDASNIAAAPEDQRMDRLIDQGLAMPHWPQPWGREADPVEQLVIDEELSSAGLKRPAIGLATWILTSLIQYGTEEQISRWVRPSLQLKILWCQLFSEPDAGSDAAAIRTRGRRVDGGWLVTGQKVWTSNARQAQLGFATIRTDPDSEKHAGITTMVIDMSALGVEVRPLREVTGSELFNEVFFNDVFVADSEVVGSVNGGWKVARSTLGNERVTIGGGEGMAVSLDPLRSWRERTTDLPGHEARVGELLAEAQAIRAMNLRRAERAVRGGPDPVDGNVTKLASAEHGQRTLELAMSCLGADAMLADGFAGEVSSRYLFSRQNSIGGGTSEISRNQIGERTLGLPRDPLAH